MSCLKSSKDPTMTNADVQNLLADLNYHGKKAEDLLGAQSVLMIIQTCLLGAILWKLW
jgi:hypothetical protein